MSVDEELARKVQEEEQAKTMVKQEQERINFEAVVELQRQLNEREENRPYSVAEVRKNMVMYLKNQAGYKQNSEDKEKAADYEQEKAELRLWLKVAQDDEESVNPEILSTKYPIVDWEYQLLCQVGGKDFEVYKLTRADGSASYHGNIQAFLRRLYREDLSTLYRLVQERFQDHPLEGRVLLLWGDLRMIFDPNEKDDIYDESTRLEIA
ncbi:hypothetical protein Tco_0685676 [Tanacetum coccineum]